MSKGIQPSGIRTAYFPIKRQTDKLNFQSFIAKRLEESKLGISSNNLKQSLKQ